MPMGVVHATASHWAGNGKIGYVMLLNSPFSRTIHVRAVRALRGRTAVYTIHILTYFNVLITCEHAVDYICKCESML